MSCDVIMAKFDFNQISVPYVTYSYADAIFTCGHSSLEKYTSHFIHNGWKGLRKVMCERWFGDWTKTAKYWPPNSSSQSSASFSFSWAAQPGAWGPSLSAESWFPQLKLEHWLQALNSNWLELPVHWLILLFYAHSIQTVDSQGYPLTSSTGCTCYLHRYISYFDSLAGSEVNMQHLLTYILFIRYNYLFIILNFLLSFLKSLKKWSDELWCHHGQIWLQSDKCSLLKKLPLLVYTFLLFLIYYMAWEGPFLLLSSEKTIPLGPYKAGKTLNSKLEKSLENLKNSGIQKSMGCSDWVCTIINKISYVSSLMVHIFNWILQNLNIIAARPLLDIVL